MLSRNIFASDNICSGICDITEQYICNGICDAIDKYILKCECIPQWHHRCDRKYIRRGSYYKYTPNANIFVGSVARGFFPFRGKNQWIMMSKVIKKHKKIFTQSVKKRSQIYSLMRVHSRCKYIHRHKYVLRYGYIRQHKYILGYRYILKRQYILVDTNIFLSANIFYGTNIFYHLLM